jgi:hypothetical protein
MRYLIAVPSHDYVHAEFVRCLMELDKPENTGFAPVTNTLIYTARNLIAQNAVKNGFDRVLWIDADMTFPADTMIRLAEDMDKGIDFVSALYFSRKKPVFPTIHKEIRWKVKPDGWIDSGAELYHDYPHNQLFEVEACGFGCCMTSAALLKRMCDKYGSPFYPLMGMGEDTTFCFRATQDGEKIYCDSRIQAGHIGQYTFTESDYFEQNKWRPDK